MKNLTKIAVFFCAIYLLASNNLFAVDFRIDQGRVRVTLPPGWSDGGVITVENRGKEPIAIRVYSGDWVYSDQDGSKNFMPANTSPRSCANWIKFYPADFTIPKEGKQKVNFVVAVPPDAVGGHYAVLFFEVSSGTTWDEKKGVMVHVYNRVGSLFHVEPDGTSKKEGRISDFSIKTSKGNIEATAVFQNVGNVEITGRATFDVIDEEGVVFARGEFKEFYTMPDDKAELYARCPLDPKLHQIPQGKYDVVLTLDLDGMLLVKEYQIEVSDTGNITKVKETTQ
ncbi:MAG: hypothetical protein PHS93_05500 [Candidatus Omnitrophica bacterium]|nr:hypothetical protein [Candidatus Omnitrophota bacterium]MDD5352605.1 hypothetical protein [Candidatus Omnitrophota bacterium]MDD5550203.1 hypothetical protein [Candidatus Omnitrophota bacterium]